jgi:hypothetical protein
MVGDGIPRNNTLANEMFELAASMGHRQALFEIGSMRDNRNHCGEAVEAWKQVAEDAMLPQLEKARASFLGGDMFQVYEYECI